MHTASGSMSAGDSHNEVVWPVRDNLLDLTPKERTSEVQCRRAVSVHSANMQMHCIFLEGCLSVALGDCFNSVESLVTPCFRTKGIPFFYGHSGDASSAQQSSLINFLSSSLYGLTFYACVPSWRVQPAWPPYLHIWRVDDFAPLLPLTSLTFPMRCLIRHQQRFQTYYVRLYLNQLSSCTTIGCVESEWLSWSQVVHQHFLTTPADQNRPRNGKY